MDVKNNISITERDAGEKPEAVSPAWKTIGTLLLNELSLHDGLIFSATCKSARNVWFDQPWENLLAKCERRQIINAFCLYHSRLPPQGSAAWVANRSTTVGGSEIATVIGCNAYQNANQLMLSKLGANKFGGNIATRWGNLFEPYIREHVSRVWGVPIFETSSVPGAKLNGSVIQTYSPDGLAYLPNGLPGAKRVSNAVNGVKDGTTSTSGEIILCEFKCPFSRLPNGKVPEHYVPQPQLGMCTMPFVDSAMFIDTAFRACTLAEIGISDGLYCSDWHKDKAAASFTSCGFLGFYEKMSCDVEMPADAIAILADGFDISRPVESLLAMNSKWDEIYDSFELAGTTAAWEDEQTANVVAKLMNIDVKSAATLFRSVVADKSLVPLTVTDYGANVWELEKIMERYVDGRRNADTEKQVDGRRGYVDTLSVYYDCPLIELGTSATAEFWQQIAEFKRFCVRGGYKCLGVLPWKCCGVSMIPMKRDPNFWKETEPKLHSFIAKWRELREDKSILELNGDDRTELIKKKLGIRARVKKVVITKEVVSTSSMFADGSNPFDD